MNYEEKVRQHLIDKGFSFEDRHGYTQFNYTNVDGEPVDRILKEFLEQDFNIKFRIEYIFCSEFENRNIYAFSISIFEKSTGKLFSIPLAVFDQS